MTRCTKGLALFCLLVVLALGVACSSPPVDESPRPGAAEESLPLGAAPVLEDATPADALMPEQPVTDGNEPAALSPPKLVDSPVREFSPAVSVALDRYGGELHIVIGARIDETGRVIATKPKLAQPEGLELAREVALEMAAMVTAWRYEPATRDGVPVSSEIEVKFDLEGGQTSR